MSDCYGSRNGRSGSDETPPLRAPCKSRDDLYYLSFLVPRDADGEDVARIIQRVAKECTPVCGRFALLFAGLAEDMAEGMGLVPGPDAWRTQDLVFYRSDIGSEELVARFGHFWDSCFEAPMAMLLSTQPLGTGDAERIARAFSKVGCLAFLFVRSPWCIRARDTEKVLRLGRLLVLRGPDGEIAFVLPNPSDPKQRERVEEAMLGLGLDVEPGHLKVS